MAPLPRARDHNEAMSPLPLFLLKSGKLRREEVSSPRCASFLLPKLPERGLPPSHPIFPFVDNNNLGSWPDPT